MTAGIVSLEALLMVRRDHEYASERLPESETFWFYQLSINNTPKSLLNLFISMEKFKKDLVTQYLRQFNHIHNYRIK